MFSPPNVMWAVCRLQWCTIVKFCIVKCAIVETEVWCWWSWCSGDDCAGVRMIEQCSRDTAGASRKLNFSTQLWFAHFQHSGHRWIMCSVMHCNVRWHRRVQQPSANGTREFFCHQNCQRLNLVLVFFHPLCSSAQYTQLHILWVQWASRKAAMACFAFGRKGSLRPLIRMNFF